jgi:hypothetical protein
MFGNSFHSESVWSNHGGGGGRSCKTVTKKVGNTISTVTTCS